MTEARVESSQTEGSLWKHGDFLKLWTAQTISAVGDQFTGLAIPLIAALVLQATPWQMGLLTAFERAPFLIIGLFAGVWVDRLPRRPILIAGDLGRALVLLSIPVAAIAGALNMVVLYVVGLTVGLLTVFFDVAYQAFLPALVNRGQLVDGNSKLEASRSIANLAGPSIAGVAIQTLSAPVAIVVDAVSFIISGGVINLIQRREPHQDRPERSPMMAEVREGLSVVLGNRLLRPIAGCTGTWNFFSSALSALFILFVTRDLGLGPLQIGLIFSIGNVSGVVGALSAGWLGVRLGLGRAIVGGAVIGTAAAIPIALATPHTAFPVLILSGLVSSFAAPVYNINQVSLRQAITPHRLQGRMNATMRFVVWGTMPFGGLLGGVLGEALGLRPAITITAVGTLFSLLWVLFSPVRGLRTIPVPVN